VIVSAVLPVTRRRCEKPIVLELMTETNRSFHSSVVQPGEGETVIVVLVEDPIV
jgi:hypothetical protein